MLSFDSQESLVDLPFIQPENAAGLMREYYRGARSIFRAAMRASEESTGKSSSMLQSFRDWVDYLRKDQLFGHGDGVSQILTNG